MKKEIEDFISATNDFSKIKKLNKKFTFFIVAVIILFIGWIIISGLS